MSLSDFLSSSRSSATTHWLRQMPIRTRRALVRADHGVQDHIVLTTVLALTATLLATGTALWYWGEPLLALAKKYQPLFTIVWIVISAVLLVINFFRVRRAVRLASVAPAPAVTIAAGPAHAEALPGYPTTDQGSRVA